LSRPEGKAPTTLDDASDNIRHVRQKFSPSLSKLDSESIKSLRNLFEVAEIASLTKALTVENIISQGRSGMSDAEHRAQAQKLVSIIDLSPKPPHLEPAFEMIRRAIVEQLRFRKGYAFQSPTGRQAGTLPVLFKKEYSAARLSENLEEASNYLLELFPNEHPANRQSFVDHFKAMDFCHLPGEG
jgi:hypothetical protein